MTIATHDDLANAIRRIEEAPRDRWFQVFHHEVTGLMKAHHGAETKAALRQAWLRKNTTLEYTDMQFENIIAAAQRVNGGGAVDGEPPGASKNTVPPAGQTKIVPLNEIRETVNGSPPIDMDKLAAQVRHENPPRPTKPTRLPSPSAMTIEDLLRANKIRLKSTAPGRYYTTCPQCSAKRTKPHQRSKVLGVTIDAKGVCWGCNHCGWKGPEKGSGHDRSDENLATYDYVDENGNLLFQKVRAYPKKFWQRKPDGAGGWINNLGDVRKVIYRLPEVIEAMAAGHMVVSVEGEKDADNLWKIGIPATCSPDGAAELGKKPKWRREYSEMLRGADLVVVGDNDDAGRAHVEATAAMSIGIAERVRVLDLAMHWLDMPKGKDISDWLAIGHTREELDFLINTDAKPWGGDKKGEPNGEGRGSKSTAADRDTAGDTASEPLSDTDFNAEISRLAKLSLKDYERQRNAAIKRLNIRASGLDRLVAAERGDKNGDGKQGRALDPQEPEQWSETVNGADLLNDLSDALRRHVVMHDYEADAAALWVVHTYMLVCFDISPRLAITSPEKQCGKTTLLDVLGCLAWRPMTTGSITAASIFRVVEKVQPTLLIDEADTFLAGNEELRGILNTGHRRGGSVIRTIGDDHEPRRFSTYSACVVALIGELPDTLADRSISIRLRRRRPDEPILDRLARQAARWAADNADRVRGADPEMPAGVFNRNADNWLAALAIADAAGGEWPNRGREAAGKLSGVIDTKSAGVELLDDIRTLFCESGADCLPSGVLIAKLIANPEGRWAEYGKGAKPLTQRQLARLLKPYGITSGTVHPEGAADAKGYQRQHFEEAWKSYL